MASYDRYSPSPNDFEVEAKHMNSHSRESLEYWASVLHRCDTSTRIYVCLTGGRDVFALGSIIVKSSHLHKTGDGQPPEVEKYYVYHDANEVRATALAKTVLNQEDLRHVRVPKTYFAGKINGRQVLIHERIPGVGLNIAWPGLDEGEKRYFKQQARDILRALRDTEGTNLGPFRPRNYAFRDPAPLTNGRIQPLEAEILFSKNNDPDLGFMHNNFTMSNCIVDNDKIVGLINWEMAGFFGWKRAGQVHRRIRTPQREHFADAGISENMLSYLLWWNDLYDYEH
ncbi:hypothetical protein Hte_003337 [Hypoxylon texense]